MKQEIEFYYFPIVHAPNIKFFIGACGNYVVGKSDRIWTAHFEDGRVEPIEYDPVFNKFIRNGTWKKTIFPEEWKKLKEIS